MERPGAGMAITPCADEGENSTFTCGLGTKGCQSENGTFKLLGGTSLVLRATQIQELLEPVLASMSSSSQSTPTPTFSPDSGSDSQTTASPSIAANATRMYTSSQMAGLGCGLGLPLTFFLVVALCALYKERQNHTGPKLMYKLPDNHEEFLRRPPALALRAHSSYSVDSRFTSQTFDSKPANPHSFLDRYGDGKISEFQVHEMDGVSPHEPAFRHELSDKRFSTPSGK